MNIAFIGDVHGRAYHALSVLLTWQSMRERPFDLVVQLGDLGVLPESGTGEIPYDWFSEWDPSVYDMGKLILLEGADAQVVREARGHLASPTMVVAGNHDEFAALHSEWTGSPKPVPIDPHGLFQYIPDGFLLEHGEERVGCCEGGDPEALQQKQPIGLKVLVSHEGGFGAGAVAGASADNLSEGPEALLEFLRIWKPAFHVFGHFHHPVAPRKVHDTLCAQIASVVSDPRRGPREVINEGCIGALDTETGEFEFVEGNWLKGHRREGGFELLTETLDRLT